MTWQQCPISGCQYIITWQRCPISGCQRIAVTINKVSCQHNRLVQSAAASASSHDTDNSLSLESDHDDCVSICQEVSHDEAVHSVFDVSFAIRNGCNVSTRQCYSEDVYNLQEWGVWSAVAMLQPSCARVCGLWTVVRTYQPDTNLSVWQSLTQSTLLWWHQREYSNVQDNQEHFTTAASFIMPHSARELLPWYICGIMWENWCPGSNNFLFCWQLYLGSRDQMLASYDIYNYWCIIKYS